MLKEILATITNWIVGPRSPASIASALDEVADNTGEGMDWRNSIVDLLKLLNMDSSIGARQRLAHELGRDHFIGSADDNIWLHGEVMKAIGLHTIPLPR